ncbi:MAG: type IA DNA topoisomerase [Lachnospiraceae bacterium]|jgi:DNA topoisomerase-3|nr:type IA DNA topoisomerase [Lachnospiraceae bacterium]
MSKSLYIAEKPSVAQQFADALKIKGRRQDGFIESDQAIVTWCVGHLVTMSYPDAYDPALKRWSMETLPFLPEEFKYQVIDSAAKQFRIVSGLLNRADVDTIYVCTDSGREGEYIYRLVAQMAGVRKKAQKRVWIDSQTEEEIIRGIQTAKELAEYDNLSESAYLRAKEDYLMGINFSRVLTLKYGPLLSAYLKTKSTVVSVGRVMTCVLGMAVRREREIRDFVKMPFYRVTAAFELGEFHFNGEWKAVEGSRYWGTPVLYKDNGFRERKDAQSLIDGLMKEPPVKARLVKKESKKETKNPPLLYNLAELQNDCSRLFKISPDQALSVVQELYEKKLVTYPRTDARVLSTAVAKEIRKNIGGLKGYDPVAPFAEEALLLERWKDIAKTRYVNDQQITDHYAIIPTGQGLGAIKGLKPLQEKIYQLICRRFLSIFYPGAVYQKYSLDLEREKEHFFANFKVLLDPGYLKVTDINYGKKDEKKDLENKEEEAKEDQENKKDMENPEFLALLKGLKKDTILNISGFSIKEGETSPPKRYTSGSMILAMENAGQLIEDEELRAQIKGSGIGTSATRAEILKKLTAIQYLELNKKTQVITPTLLGELIFEVVNASIRQLLNPELTASWEKGLAYVAEGSITSEEYMEKLNRFVAGRTIGVKRLGSGYELRPSFDSASAYYKN